MGWKRGTIGTLARWYARLEWKDGDSLTLANADVSGETAATWHEHRGTGREAASSWAAECEGAMQRYADGHGGRVEMKLRHLRDGVVLSTDTVRRVGEKRGDDGEDTPRDVVHQSIAHNETMHKSWLYAHGTVLKQKDETIADLRQENKVLRRRIEALEGRLFAMIDQLAEAKAKGPEEYDENSPEARMMQRGMDIAELFVASKMLPSDTGGDDPPDPKPDRDAEHQQARRRKPKSGGGPRVIGSGERPRRARKPRPVVAE